MTPCAQCLYCSRRLARDVDDVAHRLQPATVVFHATAGRPEKGHPGVNPRYQGRMLKIPGGGHHQVGRMWVALSAFLCILEAREILIFSNLYCAVLCCVVFVFVFYWLVKNVQFFIC